MSVRRQTRQQAGGRQREFWIVDIEHRDLTGRVRRIRKVPRPQTRVAAERLEREILRQLESGTYGVKQTEPESISFAKFAEEFKTNYAATNNKPSECYAKKVILDKHLVPVFGKCLLEVIDVRRIEAFKAQQVGLGVYSPKSINNQLGVLRKLLRFAAESPRSP